MLRLKDCVDLSLAECKGYIWVGRQGRRVVVPFVRAARVAFQIVSVPVESNLLLL